MKKNFLVFILFFMIIGTGDFYGNGDFQKDLTLKMRKFEYLINKAYRENFINVIVKMNVKNFKSLTKNFCNDILESRLNSNIKNITKSDSKLKDAINKVKDNIIVQLSNVEYKINHTYSNLPYITLRVSPDGLVILNELPEVLYIIEDIPFEVNMSDPESALMKEDITVQDRKINKPLLYDTTDLIGAKYAWDQGFTGEGWYVAVVDSGIRNSHRAFEGKDIIEACFINDKDEDANYGPGSAAHDDCDTEYHGTSVASVAVGNIRSGCSYSLEGVAKGANIIAIRVFSWYWKEVIGGDPGEMKLIKIIYLSDLMRAFSYIMELTANYKIAAINMSINVQQSPDQVFSDQDSCGNNEGYDVIKEIVTNLNTNYQIPTIIASGNASSCIGVHFPACIDEVITVSNSTKSDEPYFNGNWHYYLVDFFAPGKDIFVASGKDDCDNKSQQEGTSFSAPHVAGAWAILKQYKPYSTFVEISNALKTSGELIYYNRVDCRDGYTPRINIRGALQLINPIEINILKNPNEEWILGSQKEINWKTNGIDRVTIALLRNCQHNCETVGLIANATENDGSYIWTVGNCEFNTAEPGSHYQIKIIWEKDVSKYDISDYPFTISEQKPTITVTSPNGGEKWIINSTEQIRWSATPDNTGNVKIDLLRSGVFLETIVDNSNNIPVTRGYYDWIVGDNITTPLQCRDDYQIKISSISDLSISDVSDSNFTITALETIDVDPGNEMKGKTYFKYGILPIKWNSTACAGATWKVRVYLCRPNTTIATIGDFDRSVTSYNYTIPNTITPASDYFIKARKVNPDDHSVYDISEKFSIKYNSISVTSPRANRTYDRSISKILPIRWTWQEDPKGGNVRIYLCKAYTTEYRVVATVKYDKGFNNGLNGKFDYTIPDDVVHAKYWVKVKWLTNGYVYGKTGNFIIK